MLHRLETPDHGLHARAHLVVSLGERRAFGRQRFLALAQCTIHLASAPKSNAAYKAFGAATRAAEASGSLMPPAHILNAPTRLMRELGYGRGYAYDHDAPERFSGQDYFPEGMARERYYQPTGEGEEAKIRKRLEAWAKLRATREP